MKPVIGIILRKGKSETSKDIEIMYKDISNCVIKSKGIPIGGSSEDINIYLDMCDGFILQGGDDIDEDNLRILKILKEKNKPVLGICLGMQEMAYVDNGNIYDIDNHLNNTLHEINVNDKSILYKILKKDKILVNSRHKSAVKDTDLFIGSVSKDGVIESVEDFKLQFFLGVQWHPENLYDIDSNSKKIFDYFIKVCNDK